MSMGEIDTGEVEGRSRWCSGPLDRNYVWAPIIPRITTSHKLPAAFDVFESS